MIDERIIGIFLAFVLTATIHEMRDINKQLNNYLFMYAGVYFVVRQVWYFIGSLFIADWLRRRFKKNERIADGELRVTFFMILTCFCSLGMGLNWDNGGAYLWFLVAALFMNIIAMGTLRRVYPETFIAETLKGWMIINGIELVSSLFFALLLTMKEEKLLGIFPWAKRPLLFTFALIMLTLVGGMDYRKTKGAFKKKEPPSKVK